MLEDFRNLLETTMLRILTVIVVVCLFAAALFCTGCGTVQGLCQDISSASNAIAASAHKSQQAQQKYNDAYDVSEQTVISRK